ncbi:unnamed protein product [Ceratitis capitata]|uniref:(Mediterranean fruit fly) hypothetical protein n=1 Tax=Ceratitis capitata TaxID=7213 RepID=A0A811UPT9_CERCA|nr:unnamed protein product [Ceratitis capitata]
MAVKLAQSGIEVTGIEVKFEMQNLMSKYNFFLVNLCMQKGESRNGTLRASPPTWPLFEKWLKLLALPFDECGMDTQVPPVSPSAISHAFSQQGLSSDSEQQSKLRLAQHTRSSQQQNPATANFQ